MNEILINALGLKPIENTIDVNSIDMPEDSSSGEIVSYEETYPAIPETDQELLSDLDFAKENIKSIIAKGNDSIDELIAIAKQTESARAFEVAAIMMKTMLEANRQFIDTSKDKKFEKNDIPSQHVTNVTNNNLVLSTAEMLDIIKGKK